MVAEVKFLDSNPEEAFLKKSCSRKLLEWEQPWGSLEQTWVRDSGLLFKLWNSEGPRSQYLRVEGSFLECFVGMFLVLGLQLFEVSDPKYH